MRVWCGIDVEHNPSFGKMTLFVESENPDIDKILKILCNFNYNIECVYFGAGEVDIKNWEFLQRLCEISNMFMVGLETSNYVCRDIIDYFDFIIFRLPIPCISDKIYFKGRTENVVGISNVTSFNMNSLKDLRNGQYSTDVELYVSED